MLVYQRVQSTQWQKHVEVSRIFQVPENVDEYISIDMPGRWLIPRKVKPCICIIYIYICIKNIIYIYYIYILYYIYYIIYIILYIAMMQIPVSPAAVSMILAYYSPWLIPPWSHASHACTPSSRDWNICIVCTCMISPWLLSFRFHLLWLLPSFLSGILLLFWISLWLWWFLCGQYHYHCKQ